MHRSIPIGLILILSLAAVGPAVAGGPKAREIERMTIHFERLLGPLVGAIEAGDLVFTDQGNGFLSLSYPLARAKRSGLGPGSSKGSDEGVFRTLACGHMVAEPTSPAVLATTVISDLQTPYNFWWTVVNKTDTDLTRSTTVKITGPGGFDIEASDDGVLYMANAVNLVWFNPEAPFPETGLYLHRVAVRGGGKVLYRFWAEVASTTRLER